MRPKPKVDPPEGAKVCAESLARHLAANGVHGLGPALADEDGDLTAPMGMEDSSRFNADPIALRAGERAHEGVELSGPGGCGRSSGQADRRRQHGAQTGAADWGSSVGVART
jgi:hypothetical protein